MPDVPVIKGLVTNLTPGEKIYLIRHLNQVSTILEIREKASLAAATKFPRAGQHNGKGDAFRHCYASALLARDIGAKGAKEFTDAHEAYSANPAGERAMDLHNNGIGIQIGARKTSPTDAQLQTACMNALLAGYLMTTPPAVGDAY